MKLFELIGELQTHLETYGDLDVYTIDTSQSLKTPLVCHSEKDYFASFFSGQPWSDVVDSDEPFIIIDHSE